MRNQNLCKVKNLNFAVSIYIYKNILKNQIIPRYTQHTKIRKDESCTKVIQKFAPAVQTPSHGNYFLLLLIPKI